MKPNRHPSPPRLHDRPGTHTPVSLAAGTRTNTRLLAVVPLLVSTALARAEPPAVPDSPSVLTASGEHVLDPEASREFAGLHETVFRAAIRAAASQHPDITFWSDDDTLGGQVVSEGRHREFYVGEGPGGRTLWFRDTAGPEQQFPRCRVLFRSQGPEQAAIVSCGLYLREGGPVHVPAGPSADQLRDVCRFWLDLFGGTGRTQAAARGSRDLPEQH